MDSDARILKGINIAAIILSALGALAALIVVVCGIVGAVFVGDSQFTNMMYYELSGSSSYDPYSEAILVSAFASSLMLVCIIIALFGVALKGAALTAGIFGMQAANDPQRRGAAFIWAVVAAVLNGLIGSFISMVLFIVSAVYINKMRKADSQPMQDQMPYYGSQPQGFSQSSYQQAPKAPSQQPYAQQAQQYAPVQPAPFVSEAPVNPTPYPNAPHDGRTASLSEDKPSTDQESILSAEKHDEVVAVVNDGQVPEAGVPTRGDKDPEVSGSSANDATDKKD